MIEDISIKDTLSLRTPTGKEFGISLNSCGNLKLHTGEELTAKGVLTRENIKMYFAGTPVNNWWKGYFEGVVEYLKSKYNLKQIQNDTSGDYVFIIDEINRGEMSKIFGELFYSIDPGYRGEDGKVRTQYANMLTEANEFDIALGATDFGQFFIPKNVYIIGTMNDIDRSVESMDFAMRRRFAWKEVTASDTMDDILKEVPNADLAKKAMTAINKKIAEYDDLGTPYQLGAAYFKKIKDYKDNALQKLWDYHIEGLLKEYLRGNRDSKKRMDELKKVYFDAVKEDDIAQG